VPTDPVLVLRQAVVNNGQAGQECNGIQTTETNKGRYLDSETSNLKIDANMDDYGESSKIGPTAGTQPVRAEFRSLIDNDISVLTDKDADNQSSFNNSSEFALAQQSDPSLQYWMSLTKQAHQRYIIEGGLLFKHVTHWAKPSVKLLVVPFNYSDQVLELAYNSPFGGHLGRRKTFDRIQGQGCLTWPKIDRFVQEWISRCPECQLVAPIKKADSLPLMPIPRIEIPFMDVSFGTLGSCLKATPRGNKYLLIHVDYASRYVDIVPIKNFTTENTIHALMSTWTRVGFPQKARFDQSTVNMSKLMS